MDAIGQVILVIYFFFWVVLFSAGLLQTWFPRGFARLEGLLSLPIKRWAQAKEAATPPNAPLTGAELGNENPRGG